MKGNQHAMSSLSRLPAFQPSGFLCAICTSVVNLNFQSTLISTTRFSAAERYAPVSKATVQRLSRPLWCGELPASMAFMSSVQLAAIYVGIAFRPRTGSFVRAPSFPNQISSSPRQITDPSVPSICKLLFAPRDRDAQ